MTMIASSLVCIALAFWWMGWVDAFHLASGSSFVALFWGFLLLVRRRSNPVFAAEPGQEPDPLIAPRGRISRPVFLGTAVALAAVLCLWAAVFPMLERTRLYAGYLDRDRVALDHELGTLARAGSDREATRLIEDRLLRPLSSVWRAALQRQLVDHMIRAAGHAESLDERTMLLNKAVRIAHEAQLDDRLAREQLSRAASELETERQLARLRAERRWDELAKLLDALITSPRTAGQSERLAPALVEALTECGKSRQDPEEQTGFYRRAVETAEVHGLRAEVAASLLVRIEADAVRVATLERQLTSLRQADRWDDVVATLRVALASPDSYPQARLKRELFETLCTLGTKQALPGARIPHLEEAIRVAGEAGLDAAAARTQLERARSEVTDLETLSRKVDELRLKGDSKALIELVSQRLGTPRERWGLPLDHILVEACLASADRETDPEAKLQRCEQALETAKRFSLDPSPVAERIKVVQADLAERRRLEAERQKPVDLPKGSQGGLLRVSTDAWPVVTIDTWVETEARKHLSGLQSKDFQVAVNGRSVTQVDLAPLSTRGTKLYVVVALDTSTSTANGALDAAKRGLAAFLSGLEKNPDWEVRLIAFNNRVLDVAPWSSDHPGILHHARALNAGGNTALLQAIDFGLKEVQKREGERRLVVFSDGANTIDTPGLSLPDLITRCQQARVIVHTIGLKAPGQDPETLKQIASGTGGAFLEAVDTADLVKQFRQTSDQIHPHFYRLVVRPAVSSQTQELSLDVRIGGENGVKVLGSSKLGATVARSIP